MSQRKRAPFAPKAIRSAILSSLPQEFAAFGEAPEQSHLYVPLRHVQALSPDSSLVVGIRGAGKSVWWSALQSPVHRRAMAAALPVLDLGKLARVDAGFGETPRFEDYPDRRTLQKLLASGVAPADIWRTVIAWHVWGKLEPQSPMAGLTWWSERVEWLAKHPEEVARALEERDRALAASGQKQLILFDALDRTALDWQELRELLRGLLETLLEFRAYRAIRAKAFVRPDMLDDPKVTAFRDASKVMAGKVELRWSRADLYGLLFQYLGNATDGGQMFRRGCVAVGSGDWNKVERIWQIPGSLRDDETLQRKVFHAIAGEWMGSNNKQGYPYTWLPNHLADAADQVSPRSLLAAVRAAAEHGPSASLEHALHYEGIKKGVQAASRIRVDEVTEDFAWVRDVMEPLSGQVIPCPFAAIKKLWQKDSIMDKLRSRGEAATEDDRFLLPKRMDGGLNGLRDDLIDLAIFSSMSDGRINMPDVYRVGFGLGRRGGVKAIR